MEILRKFGFIFLLFVANSGLAQISFYKVYSGNGYDRAHGIAQLPDSSYIVTGTSSSFQNAPSQAFLLKLDKNGMHEWSRSYGGEEFEEGQRVIHVPDFGYYIVGTSSSNGSTFDGFVVFTDLLGNQLWEKWYDNGGWERFHDALLLQDTSLILLGETNNNAEQEPDHFMIRIDKNGNELWSNQFGGVGTDYIQKGTFMTDSTFAVVGTGYLSDSLTSKGYVATFHKDGSLIWDTLVGANGKYILNDVQFYDNYLWCGGEGIKVGKTDFDDCFFKFNTLGDLFLSYDSYTQYDNRIVAIVNYTAAPTDKFFVVTQGNNPNFSYPGGEDFHINRFAYGFYWDAYGVGYNALGQDQVNHLIQTNDGYAICVGFHSDEGYSTGGNSLFVIKLGSDYAFPSNALPAISNILTIEENAHFKEYKIFPNPFNTFVEIQSEKKIDQLEIVDVLGQTVYSSFNPSNRIETEFLESGTYFVRLLVNGTWTTNKLIKN